MFGLLRKKIESINIYADESSVDNPQAENMIIGSIFVNRARVPEIKKKVKDIRNKHQIKGELKWIKTSQKTMPFYLDIFNYLFSLDYQDFNYKCIVVKKEDIDYEKYHESDKDLAFYKFYYQLFKNKLHNDKKYYIFLDFKPSKSKGRIIRIKKFLEMVNEGVKIKHIQSYSSKENDFIQLADILTGAVGYEKNYSKNSKNKTELINIISKSIGKDNLNFCSSKNGDKEFNIFCIKPGINSQ